MINIQHSIQLHNNTDSGARMTTRQMNDEEIFGWTARSALHLGFCFTTSGTVLTLTGYCDSLTQDFRDTKSEARSEHITQPH